MQWCPHIECSGTVIWLPMLSAVLCCAFATALQQQFRGYAKASGKGGGKAAAKPAVAAAEPAAADPLAPPQFRLKHVPRVNKADPVAKLTDAQVQTQHRLATPCNSCGCGMCADVSTGASCLTCVFAAVASLLVSVLQSVCLQQKCVCSCHFCRCQSFRQQLGNRMSAAMVLTG